MKRKEIIDHIIQYKSEINRVLELQGKQKRIGFICVSGKSPILYWVDKDSKAALETIMMALTPKELLKCIQTVMYTIKTIG
jgi:hypothetical protein